MTQAALTEDMGWSYFKRHVRDLTGVDLDAYKEPQMRRRLGQIMSRRGVASWAEYVRILRDNAAALSEFRDFFTINVSEFFRQPERYEDLRSTYLPELLRSRSRLTIWSAGCSIGAEPYSLAMLLDTIAPGRSHKIIATDIDDTVLARARTGAGYGDPDVRSVPRETRDRYLTPQAGSWTVVERVRRMVEFRRHDLLKDAYPQDIDLIVCRNVVIYFTEDAKRDIYRRFLDSLRPDGLLFVGGTEIIGDARAIGFAPASISFYRKPAVAE